MSRLQGEIKMKLFLWSEICLRWHNLLFSSLSVLWNNDIFEYLNTLQTLKASEYNIFKWLMSFCHHICGSSFCIEGREMPSLQRSNKNSYLITQENIHNLFVVVNSPFEKENSMFTRLRERRTKRRKIKIVVCSPSREEE